MLKSRTRRSSRRIGGTGGRFVSRNYPLNRFKAGTSRPPVGVCVKSASVLFTDNQTLFLSSPPSPNHLPYPPGSDCTPHTATELLGRIKKNVGNLAFFYHTFFFSFFLSFFLFLFFSTRRSESPWPVHFAYRMRQPPLPRYPLPVAILSYSLYDPRFISSLSLSFLFFSFFFFFFFFPLRQFIPFMNTFMITLHRDHLTRERNSGRACGQDQPRAVTMDKRRSRSRFLSSRFN